MYSIDKIVRTISLIGAFVFALTTAQAVTPPPVGGYPGQNTATGDNALLNCITSVGTNNTAIGFNALYYNTFGAYNTAEGSVALFSNTEGYANTAIGNAALSLNTTGYYNTATGDGALYSTTTGFGNTANGEEALFNNTTGSENTASGNLALVSNTTGSDNTATGPGALFSNGTGTSNTATGDAALFSNTTGNSNTASGTSALQYNTTGINNAADGFQALFSNTTGNYNTADGQGALFSNTIGANNAALGQNALHNNTTGSNNIALGSNAGYNLTTGGNNIDTGNRGNAGEANTIRIGKIGTQKNTYIAGVSGVTVAGGVGVIIDTNGHLGTVVSSERFKDSIKPMDKASEAILSLQPVTFRYKHDLDPEGIPQFGLVAEQVEKVDPDLVAKDEAGKPYTVRYEAVNAMLLNEFLKEHRKVEQQEANISELKSLLAQQQKGFESQIAALTAALKAQAAQIQKVSDQLRAQAPVPRVVANN